MPLYEFRCKHCGRISEFLSKMGDFGENLVCPHCGSKSLDKQMSVTALISSDGPKEGRTCCGREERCDSPPCGGGRCGRDS